MSATSSSGSSKPAPLRATIGFWVWLVGSVLLIVGGMIALAAELPGVDPVLIRGTGILIVVAGAVMAFLAGRGRSGDARFRRAASALSVALVLVVALTAVFGVVHILAVFGAALLIVGTMLNARVNFGGTDD